MFFVVEERKPCGICIVAPIERRKTLSRRSPLNVNRISRNVASQPIPKVIEVGIVGVEHRGETNDSPDGLVRPAQQSLNHTS
jgi:hypothetical protein